MSKDILERYITEQSPFGPIKSEDLAGGNGLTAFKALYSSGTEVHRRLDHHRPNCLMGRKGSGKTAFLLGKLIQDNANVVQLQQAALFSGMENVVRAFYEKDSSINAEILADIWDALIVHVVGLRLMDTLQPSDPDHEKSTIWTYIRGIEEAAAIQADDHPTTRANAVAGWFTAEVQRQLEESDERQAGEQLLARLMMRDVSYQAFRHACRELVGVRNQPVVILVDTLEDFGTNFTKLAEVTRGLLQLLARHDPLEDRYELFVCLPSEVSSLMREISANPAKSLERSLTIAWTTRELVRLAAQRFSLYLSLHDPRAYTRLGAEKDDRIAFTDARRILESVLPTWVPSGFGQSERPLMYIIRHTQLLPRQVIQFCNSIWRENASLGGKPTDVSADAVLRGIQEVEEALVEDVLGGYMARHPLAGDVCEKVLPRLRLVNHMGDVKRAIRESKAQQMLPGRTVGDATQLLVDIGALGRHRQTTDQYHEATFSFTERRMAALQDSEQACVHPVFAEVFQTTEFRTTEAEGALPVYVFGVTNIDQDR